MTLLDIGVVMPTHPNRQRIGYTQQAINSVYDQTHPAKALCIHNDFERRGAPFARQAALNMNTCEWTAFLDSDDYFGPDHLKILADAALETGADYVYSWFWMDGGADPFPVTHHSEPWDNNKPRQTTITVLVRTGLAREVGFWEPADDTSFPDGLRVGEDYNFTLGCMNLGAQIYQVNNCKTWAWRHHGQNTSGRPDRGDAL